MSKVKIKFDPIELRKIRKSTGLTQEEFAPLIGLSRETVSAYESGKNKSIPLELIGEWHAVCGEKADKEASTSFVHYVLRYLGMSSVIKK